MVEAMQPSSSRAGMTTESSDSGRVGGWAGESAFKTRQSSSIFSGSSEGSLPMQKP
jgi:hypothetical protein